MGLNDFELAKLNQAARLNNLTLSSSYGPHQALTSAGTDSECARRPGVPAL